MYRKKKLATTSTNKKVKNAQVTLYDSINFKSKLEVYAYRKLKEANIEFQYEAINFTLWQGIRPIQAVYYKPNKVGTMEANVKKLQDITYTPDFTGAGWVLETKGMQNDQYSLKCKMFRKVIEGSEYKLFLEPHNNKQVDQCIQLIQEFLVTNN